MASRNGLNPKIRGSKGIGYGRALPASFSFGNGIWPDGSHYLSIVPLVGKMWPAEGTIELWCECITPRTARELMITFTNGKYLRLTAWGAVVPALETSNDTGGAAVPNGVYNTGNKYHLAFQWDVSQIYAWGNALLPNDTSGSATQSINASLNYQIAAAVICAQTDGTTASTIKQDELRFYNKKLDIAELVNNDFNGLGGNPTITEHLFAWYQFEKFEMLDFSQLQDGSDIRQGIRDISG